MNNLNSVLIEGTLIKKPQCRETLNGKPFCAFTIASTRRVKRNSKIEDEVSVFDIETESTLAELCHKLGRAGKVIRIVGRLKQDQSNTDHSRVIIVAEHIEFKAKEKLAV
jgi:single-strand DNA-binding protein